jgi:hypothetical protein
MVAANPPSEAETLQTIERLTTDALPPGWSFRSRREPEPRRGSPDAEWTISSPDGTAATFAVEVKRSVLGRQLEEVLARLATAEGSPLVAAPYLGGSMRASLADRGVSFADTTGNLRLISDRPGLFVERRGGTKDPWPSDETLQSLRGRAAGRAVRALVDFRPPYGVRDLAKRASVPLGSLSRTLDLLDREGFVTRGERGAVTDIDWEATVRRWAQDYEFARSNRVGYYLEPRGLAAVVSKIGQLQNGYAATGAFAAQRYAPIAPARQASIYVDSAAAVAEKLRLRPAETGANVVLVEPFDPVVFERTVLRSEPGGDAESGYGIALPDGSGYGTGTYGQGLADGPGIGTGQVPELRLVAPSQLAADLLTGPGRDPSEGEELLSWMRDNEDAWRV